MPSEHPTQCTRDLYAYLKAREGQWVSALTLAQRFGLLSSRTRISEARRLIAEPKGERIEHVPHELPRHGGKRRQASGYVLYPAPAPAAASDLYDANTWTLRGGRLGV